MRHTCKKERVREICNFNDGDENSLLRIIKFQEVTMTLWVML